MRSIRRVPVIASSRPLRATPHLKRRRRAVLRDGGVRRAAHGGRGGGSWRDVLGGAESPRLARRPASEGSPSPADRSVSARPGSLCSSLVTGGETYERHSHGSASATPRRPRAPTPTRGRARARAGGRGDDARGGRGGRLEEVGGGVGARLGRPRRGRGGGDARPHRGARRARLGRSNVPAAELARGVRAGPARERLRRRRGRARGGVGESSPGVGPGAPAGGRRSIDARDDESSVQPRGATDSVGNSRGNKDDRSRSLRAREPERGEAPTRPRGPGDAPAASEGFPAPPTRARRRRDARGTGLGVDA